MIIFSHGHCLITYIWNIINRQRILELAISVILLGLSI